MKNRHVNLSVLFCLVVTVYFAFAIIRLMPTSEADREYQWDFQNYYYTAKAYTQGINPYDRQAVGAMAEQPLFKFFYFPLSLQIFTPFTQLSYRAAAVIFLSIKCCLLAYLIFLWHVVFLEKSADPWFLLFCLLAFNATIYLDLQAGNVSLIEQASLWTAFYFFLRQRYFLFSIFVVVAAIFKLSPLFFGLLLLLLDKRRRYRALLVYGFTVLVIATLAWLTDPQLLRQFFPHALQEMSPEAGIVNPGILLLIKSFVTLLRTKYFIAYPGPLQGAIYFVSLFMIVALSWKPFQKLDVSHDEDAKLAINLMCLVFVLVSPRFKDYSYVMLLLPAYFLIERVVVVRQYSLLFTLCVLSAMHVTLPGLDLVAHALWAYYPLALAFGLWVIYLIELHARSDREASGGAPP